MEEKGYQGWKNYETWVVALWIDNDQGLQDYAYEMAREALVDAPDIGNHEPQIILSQRLKEWIEDASPLAETATLYTDLLNAALSEVDWYELAEHYLKEV